MFLGNSRGFHEAAVPAAYVVLKILTPEDFAFVRLHHVSFLIYLEISIIARSKEFIVIISGSGMNRNLCTVLNNNRCVFLRYFALKLSRLRSIERFQFKLQVSCSTFSINCCRRFLSFFTSCHFMNSFSGVGVWLRRWMEIQSHVSLLTHGAPVSTRG